MPSEPALVWVASLLPATAVGWIACRLVSTFCAAWLERCRRKTKLATMDKAGQVLLAIERERRKAAGRNGRPDRLGSPYAGTGAVPSVHPQKVER
jgi:hypothetical protein